jgi:hypothetical protein
MAACWFAKRVMARMTDSVKTLTRWLVDGIPIHSAGRAALDSARRLHAQNGTI